MASSRDCANAHNKLKLKPKRSTAYEKECSQCIDIVFNGMGGSGLNAHVALSMFRDQLRIPFEITNSYSIPKSVSHKTLFFSVSYSGSTEEVLTAYVKAKRRKARIVVISSGGKLAKMARADGYPALIFEEKHNPCGQPRMGVGYNIASLFSLLKKMGYIRIEDKEFKGAMDVAKAINKRLSISLPTRNNPAKKVAQNLHGSIPIIVASEYLEGNAHIFSNQINENGKNFATYFTIPELNHHLLEGMYNPYRITKGLYFIMFNSKLYNTRNQVRYLITKKILQKNNIPSQLYQLKSKDKLSQSLEMLIIGSYISYYLSLLNNLDPSPIPWVDYFKDQLSKL